MYIIMEILLAILFFLLSPGVLIDAYSMKTGILLGGTMTTSLGDVAVHSVVFLIAACILHKCYKGKK